MARLLTRHWLAWHTSGAHTPSPPHPKPTPPDRTHMLTNLVDDPHVGFGGGEAEVIPRGGAIVAHLWVSAGSGEVQCGRGGGVG